MRFISQYPGYKFQVRPQRQRGMGDGSVEILTEPIYAEFLPVHSGAMIYENEVATAIAHFDFRGNTQLPDEATPSDPMNRLAVFDSDEFAEAQHLSDDERVLVEQRLQQLCLEAPTECLMVSDTPIAAPFPAWDTWEGPDTELLMVRLIEDGHDLPLVLHYERTFGPKRPEIIEALEQTIEAQQENVVSA
jgi:hypothetical protein